MSGLIHYRVTFANGKELEFSWDLDRPPPEAPGPLPAWTKLDYHQCGHCPLRPSEHPHCPLAVSLVSLCDKSADAWSFDVVAVEVDTQTRNIRFQAPAQKALSSLMGLIIPGSGCPHTVFLKPMAHFHLPNANLEETIYRAASMYLLAQFLLHQKDPAIQFDLAGLKRLYLNLHEVNVSISARLKSLAQKDAPINAVIILDALSQILPLSFDEAMTELHHIFQPYFDAAQTARETVAQREPAGP